MIKKQPPVHEATFDVTESGNLFLIHNPARLKRPEDSAYYYWHAFLREAATDKNGPPYGPESDLWGIFGDVTNRSFMEWWRETAEEVFVDSYGLLQGAEEIDGLEHFEKSWSAGDLIVRIDPQCSSDWIKHCLDRVLETWELKGAKGQRTQGKANIVEGPFAFHQVPDVNFLKRFLLVYQYRQQPQPVPYKLMYDKLRNEDDIDIWDSPKNKVDRKDPEKGLRPLDMEKAVKMLEKYKRNADSIISGVKEGRFPCY